MAHRLILEQDDHSAMTRLICLENTIHGLVMPINEMKQISFETKALGLKLHLDGGYA